MVGAEPVIANKSAGRRVPGHGHLAGVAWSTDVIGARVLLGAKVSPWVVWLREWRFSVGIFHAL